MNVPLKWIMLIVIIFMAIFGVAYYFIAQNNTVRTTSNVEFILQNTNIGEARLKADTSVQIQSAQLLDKEELVTNLITNIIEEQTNLNHTIQVKYAFTDSDNMPTEDDTKIRGIYFIVNTLNGNNEIISTSERRLALDIQYD